MSDEEVVGDLGNDISELYIEWNIDHFSSLSAEVDKRYHSKEFHFAGATWYLRLCPNGESRFKSKNYIGLYVLKSDSGDPKFVTYEFFWKTSNGRKETILKGNYDFGAKYAGHGPDKAALRSKIFERKSDLLPSDVLTVICTLKYSGVGVIAVGDTTLAEKLKNNIHGSVAEVSTQTEEDVCIGKLQQQFKELLLDGKHSDVVLSVKQKEFAVHRGILAARSRVFSAMMEHDMKEKSSGVVSIEDSDPETFPDFLQYLYTGSMDGMTSDKTLHLYVTADKYQVDELKSVCLEHMVNNITVENFCDILSLSLRHHERKLTGAASEFFVKNSMAIVLTPKWQVFMEKNAVAANELLVKLIREKLQ